MTAERGQIVVGWLLKILIGLTIFGVVAFEAGAVITAKVQADGLAVDAAREGADIYGNDHEADEAEEAARSLVERAGGRLVAFSVARDRRSVTVTVERRANTIFVHRIGRLKKFAVARATQTGKVLD